MSMGWGEKIKIFFHHEEHEEHEEHEGVVYGKF
jgi:hypothetical protein